MSRILNKCKNINKFSKNMTLRQQLVRAMIKIRYNANNYVCKQQFYQKEIIY